MPKNKYSTISTFASGESFGCGKRLQTASRFNFALQLPPYLLRNSKHPVTPAEAGVPLSLTTESVPSGIPARAGMTSCWVFYLSDQFLLSVSLCLTPSKSQPSGMAMPRFSLPRRIFRGWLWRQIPLRNSFLSSRRLPLTCWLPICR
jgi:hypothetical protein